MHTRLRTASCAALLPALALGALIGARVPALATCPREHYWGEWRIERWGAWPSPVGLSLGILAALVGQILVIAYHYVRFHTPGLKRVQPEPRHYQFSEGVRTHASQPGGILMLVAYLSLTWMLELMPCSYYRFDGGVRVWAVAAQMVSQDALQYAMHWLEHKGLGAGGSRLAH